MKTRIRYNSHKRSFKMEETVLIKEDTNIGVGKSIVMSEISPFGNQSVDHSFEISPQDGGYHNLGIFPSL